MVAHVCLRSWNLIRGSSARLRIGLKLRYIRLLEFVGVPVEEGKMYSESTCWFLWLLSDSRAFSESSMRRPLPFFGSSSILPTRASDMVRRTCIVSPCKSDHLS